MDDVFRLFFFRNLLSAEGPVIRPSRDRRRVQKKVHFFSYSSLGKILSEGVDAESITIIPRHLYSVLVVISKIVLHFSNGQTSYNSRRHNVHCLFKLPSLSLPPCILFSCSDSVRYTVETHEEKKTGHLIEDSSDFVR